MPQPYNPQLGNFVVQFIKALSTRHRVSLLVLGGDEILLREQLGAGTSLILVKEPSKIAQRKELQQLVTKGALDTIDLIHVHVGQSVWLHALTLKKWLNKPLVVTEHGGYLQRNEWKKLSWITRMGNKRLWQQADHLIAVSEWLKHEWSSLHKQNISVIGNFINDQWSTLPIRETKNKFYHFLHVSTLAPVKNPLGMINAIAQTVQSGYDNFHFTFVTDVDYKFWEDRVGKMGLQEHISFKGPLSPEEMQLEYQKHNCYIHFSSSETFSIVLAEAMFIGLHVISTRVGFLTALNETVYSEVNQGDSTALSFAMQRAIQNYSFGGEKNRKAVENYLEHTIFDEYNQIYTELIKR